MRDSRGVQSLTLNFVTISWLAVLLRYIVAGIDLPYIGLTPPISPTEFGVAVGAILGIWLGREYTEKVARKRRGEDGQD